MKRPENTLENYDKVYEYARNYRQPRIVSQLGFTAFNAIYQPRVSFVDELAYDQFQDFREAGTAQIFPFNHLTNIHDQFISAASIHQVMPECAGDTRVWTKSPLLNPIHKKGMGRLGHMLGGIPVNRKKDHLTGTLFEEANNELFNSTAHVVGLGQNLAIYPEGTHNKGDIRTLGKVRTGLAEVAVRLNAANKPYAITPVGMAFDPKASKLPRHANVIIGHPLDIDPLATVDEITEQTRESLQSLVTIAFDTY